MSAEPTVERIEALLRGKRAFLRFLERRVGSWADADDLLQSALLKVVARGESLRDEERLIPWFYQVLRREIADHYRRRAAAARMEGRLAEEPVGRDEELFRATCECVGDLLPALKPEYADLLQRVELQEEPLREAARRLGITPNNATVRLHRARRALGDALRDTCRLCAEHGCLDCTCSRNPRAV